MPIFGRKRNKEYQEAARLLADGKTEAAVGALRTFLEKHPKHTDAKVSLAVALIHAQENPSKDSGLTIEALQLLDEAADSNPKDPVPLFNKGVCLRDLGQLDDALESFEAAVDVEERLPLAILHMAEINYELERYEKAVELARLALIRDPGIEGALNWVPEAMKKAGYMDEEGNVTNTPWEEETPHG
ncbi:MAG: tetratricopeptide repeat protein [Candidatus Thorarchaeota archaeon]